MPPSPGRNLPSGAVLAAAALLVPAWAGGAPATGGDERPAITTHEIRLESGPLRYTAEAGRLALMDSARGVPRGFIFYFAYRVSAKDTVRPVTFVWNGGPGANSLLLHLEGLGPRRVVGSRVVDNDATLLGVTDLVFVDPIGTGFSRAATPADEASFYSTRGDFAATAEFVSRWRAQHCAPGTPIYLAGESFGSWRAAAVAERLGLGREPVAGIILISGGCPVGPLQPPEIITALRVPAWAATALYHGVLDAGLEADRDSILASALRWATERYAPALKRLVTLPAAEHDRIAQELGRGLGLRRTRSRAPRWR
jgi:carboxypeptidase C (cathepsin A)